MKILRWWTGGLPPAMAAVEAAKGGRAPHGAVATPGAVPLIPATVGIATATAGTGGENHSFTRLPALAGQRRVTTKPLL